jgi:hypothetical protein
MAGGGYPTMSNVARVGVESKEPGRGLLEYAAEDTAFCELREHPRTPSDMWRTRRHKLILTVDKPATAEGHELDTILPSELDDLEQDPREWHNRFNDERYAVVRQEMCDGLLKHLKRYGVALPP